MNKHTGKDIALPKRKARLPYDGYRRLPHEKSAVLGFEVISGLRFSGYDERMTPAIRHIAPLRLHNL